jgi:hypothetical protein
LNGDSEVFRVEAEVPQLLTRHQGTVVTSDVKDGAIGLDSARWMFASSGAAASGRVSSSSPATSSPECQAHDASRGTLRRFELDGPTPPAPVAAR